MVHTRSWSWLPWLAAISSLSVGAMGAQEAVSFDYGRVTRLLTSPLPADQAEGEKQLADAGDVPWSALLKDLRAGDPGARLYAARMLLVLLSPWARSFMELDHPKSFAFSPRRPVERAVSHARAPEIQKAAFASLKWLLDREHRASGNDGQGGKFRDSVLFDALERTAALVAEVADTRTADDLAKLISEEKEMDFCYLLMKALESVHGLPDNFYQGGICGSSTGAELRQFYAEERQKIRKARDELLAWHEKHRGEPREKRIEEAVIVWDELLKDENKPLIWHGGPGLESWTHFLAPLIRLGPPAVPLVMERMGKARSLTVEGKYGIASATMTGTADAGLLRGLFLGSPEQKKLACHIIASASSKEWEDELRSLLFEPEGDVAWEASDALAACHRKAALPILRAALKRGKFTNYGHVAELADDLDYASE